MKITRHKLLKIINETIYGSQKLPDAELERVEDEDYGLKIKANIRHGFDDDGKIVPHTPQAIVGGDSGDGMISSLENLRQGDGVSKEVSKPFAQITEFMQRAAKSIMDGGSEEEATKTFVQALDFFDTYEIGLNFNASQQILLLDSLSGAQHHNKDYNRGNVIDPRVFNAFRCAVVFGKYVKLKDQNDALDNSYGAPQPDPIFDYMVNMLHPKLSPMFFGGADDFLQYGVPSTLNQFVHLGLTYYKDKSYENFMIQLLIAPIHLTSGPDEWKGIDYVTNRLVKDMYTSSDTIRYTPYYALWKRLPGKARNRQPEDMTGKSSSQLPDLSPKQIESNQWGKKRRAVDYRIIMTIRADSVFGYGKSLPELMAQAGRYAYDESYAGDAEDIREYWYEKAIYKAYDDYIKLEMDHEEYEVAIINTVFWNNIQGLIEDELKQLFKPDEMEIEKIDGTKEMGDDVDSPSDITVQIKYTTEFVEGGIAPLEIINKLKSLNVLKQSTHDASGNIGLELLSDMFTVFDKYRDEDYHTRSFSDDAVYYFNLRDEGDINPINHTEFSFVGDGLDLEDASYAVEENPEFLKQISPKMKPHTINLSDKLDLAVYAVHKTAHKHLQKESVSHKRLQCLIKEEILKFIKR